MQRQHGPPNGRGLSICRPCWARPASGFKPTSHNNNINDPPFPSSPRASLDNVFFPSVTLCNINQGRRSFFVQKGLSHDKGRDLLQAVLGQAYFGLKANLSPEQEEKVQRLFSSEEVVKKGILTDMMYSK